MPTTDYAKQLLKDLKNRTYAAGYLTAALEEGEDVFLLALRDVAKAQGGISALARATKLNRENIYAMFSHKGNPRLSSMTAVLDKLGLAVSIKPKRNRPRAA